MLVVALLALGAISCSITEPPSRSDDRAELTRNRQRRLDQQVARITVDYDPTYGYPRSIAVDVAAMAADDEYSHTASNLRPLP